MGASLGEVFRVTRRLLTKKILKKISCIFVRTETFQTTLINAVEGSSQLLQEI